MTDKPDLEYEWEEPPVEVPPLPDADTLLVSFEIHAKILKYREQGITRGWISTIKLQSDAVVPTYEGVLLKDDKVVGCVRFDEPDELEIAP
jgi:hypothetical protein